MFVAKKKDQHARLVCWSFFIIFQINKNSTGLLRPKPVPIPNHVPEEGK
jgi:hypothetical protein